MAETWSKVVVSLDTLDPAMLDLLSHLLFEAGAIGVEVDYAQGYLENHLNLFGELAEPLPKERLEHETELIAFFEEMPDLDNLKTQLESQYSDPLRLEASEIENENWQEKASNPIPGPSKTRSAACVNALS